MTHLEDYLVDVPACPTRAVDIIQALHEIGGVLHDAKSRTVDGRRECSIALTAGKYTVVGTGPGWEAAILDAFWWFNEDECEAPLQPWGCVIDADGHELGEAGC